jgi:hypothetical protein
MAKPQIQFDPVTHTYALGGRTIPSVTQIINGVLGSGYEHLPDPEYLMQRGAAAHACYDYIARGVEFDHGPELAGYVAGCRQFFKDMAPIVLATETRVVSHRHQYAGTLDLMATLPEMRLPVLIDWKASVNDRLPFQLAGYAIAIEESDGIKVAGGVGVEIHDDGTYAITKLYDLKQERREFPALRVAWGIRQRLGLNNKSKTKGNDNAETRDTAG